MPEDSAAASIGSEMVVGGEIAVVEVVAKVVEGASSVVVVAAKVVVVSGVAVVVVEGAVVVVVGAVVVTGAVVVVVGGGGGGGAEPPRAASTSAVRVPATYAWRLSPGQDVLLIERWPLIVGVVTDVPAGHRLEPLDVKVTWAPGAVDTP